MSLTLKASSRSSFDTSLIVLRWMLMIEAVMSARHVPCQLNASGHQQCVVGRTAQKDTPQGRL